MDTIFLGGISMIYSISVKLALSSNLLKDYLIRKGFRVCYYNTATGDSYDITDSQHKDHNNCVYYCIYNSPHKPSLGLIKTLLNEPVLALSILEQ